MNNTLRNSLALWLSVVVTTPVLAQTSNTSRSLNFTEVQYLAQEEYGVPTGALVSMHTTASAGDSFLTLVTIEGTPYVADLVPTSNRSQKYQLIVEGANGKREYRTGSTNRAMRGTLAGIPGSRVAGSILDDGLHLRVEFPQGDVFWIEPIKRRVPKAASTHYIVYNDLDVRECGGKCGNGALMQRFLPASSDSSTGSGVPPTAAASSGSLKVCELACEADFEFFDAFGSVSAVEDQINNIINAVNDQFESEVGITHEITTIIVQTDSDDPYTKSEASKLLNQFRDHWKDEHNNIDRDLAKLFTGRDLDGDTIGLAFVGVICSDFAYLLVESTFGSNFSCITDLSAHELGHSWSADHCNCDNHTMNASLTCSNTFHPSKTIPEIEDHRDNVSCLSGGSSSPDSDPSDCPDGQVSDCFGNCVPDIFLGDGICDDGSFSSDGVSVFLDCPLYDCDYDDCNCPNDDAYGSAADYDKYKIQKGDKISGGKSKVKHVDNKYSSIDSELSGGKQKVQLYLRGETETDADDTDRIDVSVEFEIDVSGTTGKLYMYHVDDGEWREVKKVDLKSGFNRVQLLDLSSRKKYISSSGKIKMKFLVKESSTSSFQLDVDRMAVIVYPK